MARRSRTSSSPIENATPRNDEAVSATPVPTSSAFTALLERAAEQQLAVTYWFDPVPHPHPYPVTIRFSGRRVDVKGRLRASDRFVQDERIEQVIPGSGPISLTARIRHITAGEWAVTAQMVETGHPKHQAQTYTHESIQTHPHNPLLPFWHRWTPSVASEQRLRTCPSPLVHMPGLFPGIWGGMVGLGMIVALLLQWLIVARDHLVLGPWWAVSLGAITIGVIGAKTWYISLYRHEHRLDGWCIQGFITGAIVGTALFLFLLRVPSGAFLDMVVPGLLIAMAIGRIGCFFAGCCGGPPTAARWGVWSSDQRIGARRVPTQLMEMALALSLGIGTLIALLTHGPARGAFFVGGLAAYTLVRQGILHVRAEPRKTKFGMPITIVLSALVLIAAVMWLIW